MTSYAKQYTINKIYFPLEESEKFIKNCDKYFNSLPIVYKTSTFEYEDITYYNIQLDFKTGKLPQESFNNIMDNFNKHHKKEIISKSFYKYKKKDEDLRLCYKYTE